jgi:hypothetical protein
MAELTVPRVDFSSLGELPGIYRQNQADALRKQTLASLGQGGAVDAATLLKSGDMSLAQLGMTLQQQQANELWRREESARAQQNADRSYKLQERASNRADEGPVETAQQRAIAARNAGVDITTPQGRNYVLTGKLPEADTSFQNTIEQRKAAATANGLDPSSPGFQSYVLTGKMPREDAQPLTATDKKAILEADEGVMTAKSAIDALKKANELSAKAFSGPAAGGRGYAASFLGESSNIGKGGIATAELNNVVTSNALSQLKAIFGGAPTEGERKILLDIQGSVNQPHEVRTKIYDRARQMAERRLQFNEQRATELRGGQFYKPQGARAAPAASVVAPSPQGNGAGMMLQQAKDAIAQGAPREAVLQRLQQAGVDVSGL